jgi:hypothetical protein
VWYVLLGPLHHIICIYRENRAQALSSYTRVTGLAFHLTVESHALLSIIQSRAQRRQLSLSLSTLSEPCLFSY